MVKIRRTAIFTIIVVVMLCCSLFASCKKAEFTFEEVKQEFSQYEADLNTAVVLDHSNLYFYDRTIRLLKMVPEDIFSNFKIINNNIYFSAKEVAGSLFDSHKTYAIYRCDLYGNNLACLLRKDNLKEVIDTYNGDTVYIQYEIKNSSGRIIDSYNLNTGEYVSVAKGEDCDIKTYEVVQDRKYSHEYIEQNNSKKFSIKDGGTSEIFVGDIDYVKQTSYYKSMSKYPYEFNKISEYNGELYMVYRLFVEEDYKFIADYTFVVFELDFESKELIYKSIVQMDDIMVYDIINIE